MTLWRIIKQELLDIHCKPVDGDIWEELEALPSNYVKNISLGGCLHKYYIIRKTKRFFLFGKFDWFDQIYYTVHTNQNIGGQLLTFDTDFNYAIEEQIQLQSEIAYQEYYKN